MKEPQALKKGTIQSQTLYDLLSYVKGIINHNLKDQYWITTDVLKVNGNNINGNIYVELGSTNNSGKQTKAQGVIWSNHAHILHSFEQETGIRFEPNLNIMILVEVQFTPEYGLKLNIVNINKSYSVGAFELKLRRIRLHIHDLGENEFNRNLKVPLEFTRVAVISPENAAGLGDFKAKADLLERYNLCSFDYFAARFQGPHRVNSIVTAFADLIQNEHEYDAVCVIRGGGDKASLNELSESKLSRAICRCPIPVFTGIGHDNDSVLLDEYSNSSFSTPSMVINHIYHLIINNAVQARKHFQSLKNHTIHQCRNQRLEHIQNLKLIENGRNSVLSKWRHDLDKEYNVMLFKSRHQLDQIQNTLNNTYSNFIQKVKLDVNSQRFSITQEKTTVTTKSWQCVRESNSLINNYKSHLIVGGFNSAQLSKQKLKNQLSQTQYYANKQLFEHKNILEQTWKDIKQQVVVDVKQAQQGITYTLLNLTRYVGILIHHHKSDLIAQNNLIEAYNPQKILDRGFSLILDSDGSVIKSIVQTHLKQPLYIKLKDGVITAEPIHIKKVINDE